MCESTSRSKLPIAQALRLVADNTAARERGERILPQIRARLESAGRQRPSWSFHTCVRINGRWADRPG